ncbi:MAG: DUF5615 family PIN-like protein [Pseudomonadota bacterium]
MKFFLDEGVLVLLGTVLADEGFEVIPFSEGASKGSSDTVVAEAAIANDAVLVAMDRDMRSLAKAMGVSRARFKKLSLLLFRVDAVSSLARVRDAVPYIRLRLELTQAVDFDGRRMWVEVLKTSIKILDKL